MAEGFAAVQAKLGAALAANSVGSGVEHVMIALPSYSVSESILSHYGHRIPSLEHRYLNALAVVSRIESCEIVYISTQRPGPEVVDYYIDVMPAHRRTAVRSRITLLEVEADGTPRSVAARLCARADLVAQLRAHIGDRPAFIEPWNVTDNELSLAIALGVPINGTPPDVRQIAFKSAGRRLFGEAGVPVPFGCEDVRTIDDVIEAVHAIRAEHPDAPGVVIKHDDSGAGDGNVVIDLAPMDAANDPAAWLRERLEALPAWYLTDLALGGVVEERITGTYFTSPSAQVDIRPTGEVVVLATHEQVLGGEGGQVYLGCRFPADGAYAPELADHAEAVGAALAQRGALGRFSVDFVATADAAEGPWRIYALEVNLRKGGTTHPYATLRNLVPGRYDLASGSWIAAADGSSRFYSSTDNMVDPRWLGLAPAAVLDGVAAAGLQFDPERGVGTVLHMLSGLAIDGRFGLTAIGRSPDDAAALEVGVRAVMDRLCEVPRT